MSQSFPRRPVDPAATVNEILLAHPAAVSVFNDFGIDACCGGDASLIEAARRDGVELDAVLEALEVFVAGEREIPR